MIVRIKKLSNDLFMSERFFRPWVGTEYSGEGINGKKLLVIGASQYCTRTDCSYWTECTSESNKDCRKFNSICPDVLGNKYVSSLENWSNFEIENYLEEGGYVAYRNFTNLLLGVSGLEDKQDIWKRLAFTLYVQFFLPGKDTPDMDFRDAKFFKAFLESVDELQPDIIIIWGVKILNHLKQEFIKEYVDEIKFSPNNNHLIKMKYKGKVYNIISTYHPSSIRYWHDDIPELERVLKSVLHS